MSKRHTHMGITKSSYHHTANIINRFWVKLAIWICCSNRKSGPILHLWNWKHQSFAVAYFTNTCVSFANRHYGRRAKWIKIESPVADVCGNVWIVQQVQYFFKDNDLKRENCVVWMLVNSIKTFTYFSKEYITCIVVESSILSTLAQFFIYDLNAALLWLSY